MLEAAITERVRNMVRGVSSRKIQCIRGDEQAQTMVQHLKSVMANKGINNYFNFVILIYFPFF